MISLLRGINCFEFLLSSKSVRVHHQRWRHQAEVSKVHGGRGRAGVGGDPRPVDLGLCQALCLSAAVLEPDLDLCLGELEAG